MRSLQNRLLASVVFLITIPSSSLVQAASEDWSRDCHYVGEKGTPVEGERVIGILNASRAWLIENKLDTGPHWNIKYEEESADRSYDCAGHYGPYLPNDQMPRTLEKLDLRALTPIQIDKIRTGNLLRGACLRKADLSGLNLDGVDLSGADLYKANLSGTSLENVNLSGAILHCTNLQNADLTEANLTDADLFWTEMDQAFVPGANFQDARFEVASIPLVQTLVDVGKYKQNLASMTYQDAQVGLERLRAALQDAGMRSQEREITYAIKHAETEKDSPWLSWIPYLLFDLTCKWGAEPWCPFWGFWLLIGLFASIYFILCRTKVGMILLTPTGHGSYTSTDEERDIWRQGWWLAVRYTVYFSILSAFRIGWREFSFATWLRRIQRRDYSLEGTDWVRFASGWHSLLSVYLLALWILTYFGRPFE